MTGDPVETTRTARERLMMRKRSFLEYVASMDKDSLAHATDLKIFQDAIDVVDKALEEEHTLQSKFYDGVSGRHGGHPGLQSLS